MIALGGCAGALKATGRRFDLERTVPGDETVEQAVTGCPGGVDVALWTIEGGGHGPAFTDGWAGSIWAFLAAHPKVPPGSS